MKTMKESEHSLAAAAQGRRLASLMLALLIAGCGLFPEKPMIPGPLALPGRTEQPRASAPSGEAHESRPKETGFFQTPKPPTPARAAIVRPQPAEAERGMPVEASVNLENLPLAQFIETVFAHILKRNISLAPEVQGRSDMVSLRTGKPQTDEQLFEAARAVLRSYGVAINEFQGLLRFVPDNAQAGYLPEIRRGRALPEVPGSLRPVFHLVELENTLVTNAANWLRVLFPGGRLNVQDDAPRNALLLSGQSDTVNAAIEAIQILDQPLMRGRLSARISPAHTTADELSKRILDALTAEGYAVATNPAANTPILVIPVGALNAVIVFAVSENTLNHALRWGRELDRPQQAGGSGYILYQVRNTVAADLAKTLQEVMGAAASPPPSGAAGAVPAARAAPRVVVNPASNSLIIQATAAEFQKWRDLLQELDRPGRSALMMATVAEVRLTESEQFGFQWLAKQFMSHGYNVNLGTGTPGSYGSLAGSVFRIALSGAAGDPRALLSMLASTNKVRILSNPSIIARNGETATIQVGQEVPILTSQVSSANTGTLSGTTGILQTIQYRNTGVILKVKPVIHSGGRIDLEVAQEVSAAQANETGVNSSPVISTRKVDTKLTMADGGTVLLGGLMQEQKTDGHSGIPLLKDIPVVGPLFRTGMSENSDRTELVVLITSYVIEDDFDARAVTDAFRGQFDWARALPGAQPQAAANREKPAAPAASKPLPAAPAAQPYVIP